MLLLIKQNLKQNHNVFDEARYSNRKLSNNGKHLQPPAASRMLASCCCRKRELSIRAWNDFPLLL